jgi:iron(III) transport system substrate-binding protein
MTKVSLCLLTICLILPVSSNAEQINIYSARKENLIKPILTRFAEQHSVEINLVTGKADALISRLQNEGEFTPADLLITVDAGRLVRAKQMGLTQAFDSEILKQKIPVHLRDPDHHWFALSVRARPILYANDKVKIEQLNSMLDLTHADWRNRICIRSSNNIYNQSLVAGLLAQHGADITLNWSKGLVANFARDPAGGDRDQIKALAAGQCDIAIANTYYLAAMLNDPSTDPAIAKKVRVFWSDQSTTGAHVNISGAAITAHATNVRTAQMLLEFMLETESQHWYTHANQEYPVKSGIEWSDTLKTFGEFKMEQVPMQQIGQLNAEAVKIMDKAGWR